MTFQRLTRVGGLILAVMAMFTSSSIAIAGVEDLTISNVTQVSATRVGRAVNEYVFTATVSNSAESLENVVGTVASTNPATQVVDGAVTFGAVDAGATVGADTFTIRHNRRYRFSTSNLSWSFTADEPQVNTAPIADAGADQQVNVGATVGLDGFGSTDADDDPITYAWTLTRPPGSAAALSDSTSATPSFVADVVGQYTASLIVNDGRENSTQDSALITAIFAGENPPVITSTPVSSGSIGEAYSYNVDATDADQGDVLTYSLQLAPNGMAIDSGTGLISWDPDTTGPTDVDVLVTDVTGLTARQIYLLTINNGNDDQPPSLEPIADQTTVVNQTVMAVAIGTDPEGEALSYTILDGPTGVSINTVNGQFFWTPESGQVGVFPVTVSAMDPGGQQASTSFSVEVIAEVNNPPDIGPIANQIVMPLTTVQLTLSATDSDPGEILAFSLSGQPEGMQFDATSAALSWTPDLEDVGTVLLTATVTDSAGASDSTQFSVTVTEPQEPPVAVNDAYTVDRNQQLQVQADGVLTNDSDPNNDVLTASNTSEPSLGTLDLFPGNGAFDYTPPANPPITIGLQEECRSPLNTGFAGNTQVVGDVDNDGEPETVSVLGGVGSNRFWIMNGNDCSLEVDMFLPRNPYGVFDSVTPPSLANLDDDPELEIVVVYFGRPQGGIAAAQLIALNIDGSFVWDLPGGVSEPLSIPLSPNSQYQNQGPTITDLDGDGSPEIVMALRYGNAGGGLFFGAVVAYNADGTVRWEYTGSPQSGDSGGKPVYIADLDLDGTLEVLSHTDVLDHNGQLEFLLAADLIVGGGTGAPHLTLAIANLDNDPFPEILAKNTDFQYVFSHTGAIQRRTPRSLSSTSEITVAEFDGDPLPEYVYMEGTGSGNNASWLTAFDTDGTVLWTHEGTVYDGTGAGAQLNTGPSTMAFDFDRDGIDEIVIVMNALDGGDGLFVFDGADGSLIEFFDGTGGPGPVVGQTVSIVDMDLDGEAEILYLDYNAAFDNPYRILGGLTGNAFPPARPVRNQRMYVPTHVDPSGVTLPYPQPHWLIPGLNKWNSAPVLPDEDPGAMDSFNYIANDGSSDSNEATVSIQITNVNAPTIISNPVLGGSPDFAYQYGLLATDGDLGDLFTWTLLDAPPGMAVSTFGIIDWLPTSDDLGSHRVQVAVTDLQGNSDEQTFTILVEPPVVVPNIVGSADSDAVDDLEAAGLAVGSVTQAFSFDVPVGEVISQSVSGGATSAAGAFIDYVVSLGPQPIFVPTLADLGADAAAAQLDALRLNLGVITPANDDDVPAGLILTQSVAPNTEVTIGTVVDVTVSSGPAMAVTLNSPFIAAGDSASVTITLFDESGVPIVPQPSVSVSLDFESSQVIGAVPVVGPTSIQTSADTRGGFALVVDAGAFGTRSVDFLVRGATTADTYFAPIVAFADSLQALQSVYDGLGAALRSGDLLAVQSLGQQLQNIRAGIDLEDLGQRNPFAPEEGFHPTVAALAGSGLEPSFGEFDFLPGSLANLEDALAQSRSFLETFNPAVGRDDDVRSRALNNTLEAQVTAFFASERNAGAYIAFNAQYFDIFAKQVPTLVAADLDLTILLLQDAGLLAVQSDVQAEQWASVSSTYAVRPAFFTLGGMMSATSIRNTLITKLYIPHIKNLVAANLLFGQAELLVGNPEAIQITGLITGASTSFHRFLVGNTAVEAPFVTTEASSFLAGVIGPDSYLQAINDLQAVASASNPGEFLGRLRNLKDTAEALGAAFTPSRTEEIVRGCVFDQNPECKQMLIRDGFKVVHNSGPFPAPVLVLITDEANFKTYYGVFAFFPN